jgi:hypothetical protein
VPQAVELATEVVWSLSGRQFGLCEVTLRPCRRDCREYPFPADLAPFPGYRNLLASAAVDVGCTGCDGSCSCTGLSEVVLPAPVHSVTQVKVDGVVVSGSGYRLDDNRILVRLGASWPTCNDLARDDDQPGTWSVTAEYGTPVPEGGTWAVGELACELLKARNGEDCRLPKAVTQLVRQGATIQFPNAVELLREGLTGLWLVDMFVQTWNPNRLKRRSSVYSVDRALHRRTGP